MIFIKKNICYIIGASPENCDDLIIDADSNDFIIAADGGFDTLKMKNISADMLLGDFDSIDSLPKHSNISRHPVEKDFTDTFLAYEEGKRRGYRNFIIYGGVGGRFDHTLANLQTLENMAAENCRGFLLADGMVITCIKDTYIDFTDDYLGILSLFCVGNDAEKVTISGLKYNTENIMLTSKMPLGVSNEFVGKQAKISVQNGTVLIIWYEQAESFFKHCDNFLI